MDVDIALVTEIDRRKDNVLIFGTGKSLNERFTPSERSYVLTINEDFVAPSNIPVSKDRVVFKNQKSVPVHERFSSYKNQNWEENDKSFDAYETRKWLEESLRSFSKQRRRVVSPKSSRNKKLTNSKSGTTYSAEASGIKNKRYSSDDTEYPRPQQKGEVASGKKMNLFSPENTESPKRQRKTELHDFEVTSSKKMNRLSPEDTECPKRQRKAEVDDLEITSSKKINRFSSDIKSPKPQRKIESNSFELTSGKKIRFSSNIKSPKPQRKAKETNLEVTSGKKMDRFSFGDFESRKPKINLILTSDKKMKRFSAGDLESTTRRSKVETTLDRDMDLFLSGDLEPIKPYENPKTYEHENSELGVTLDKKKNQLSSGDFESIAPYEKPKKIYKSENCDLELIKSYERPKQKYEYKNCDLEVTLSEKIIQSPSGDSKSLAKFTDGNQSVEDEYNSNSDCICKGNEAFKRPWSGKTLTKHVSFGTENEYLSCGSYNNYGFGRQKYFNSSPYHYYRNDIQEVRSYTWRSEIYQWNRERPTKDRERPTKEQLDDEIDRYMSEVKLKPPTAEEDDLDSFVEEYIMETEKVLSQDDSELDLRN